MVSVDNWNSWYQGMHVHVCHVGGKGYVPFTLDLLHQNNFSADSITGNFWGPSTSPWDHLCTPQPLCCGDEESAILAASSLLAHPAWKAPSLTLERPMENSVPENWSWQWLIWCMSQDSSVSLNSCTHESCWKCFNSGVCMWHSCVRAWACRTDVFLIPTFGVDP